VAQSWGQCNLSWPILPQTRLATATNVNPTFEEFKTQGYAIAQAANKTVSVDFEGVMLIYKGALDGAFAIGGGYGEVNGLTAYMVRSTTSIGSCVPRSSPTMMHRKLLAPLARLPVPNCFCVLLCCAQSDPVLFDVTRHEAGHCFGHPHHHSNKYYWRLTRSVPEAWFDGYDMMSGGNGYDVSHFNPVSKW
jgi:hypothetical protein